MKSMRALGVVVVSVLPAWVGCVDLPGPSSDAPMSDGPIAEGIAARLGDPLPSASAEQRETFERGKAVFQRRFDLADGLGPAFNVTFCGACHERPVAGGSAGLYRNFALSGRLTADGAFLDGDSAGKAGGVIRAYHYGPGERSRPAIPEETTIIAQRNPIAFFGAGLLAELDEQEILSRADADDSDGDGISGRPNFDKGFVGRFGRKSQTVSIEGFIRGPLFNHLGVTTAPLTEVQRSRLPVDSTLGADRGATPKRKPVVALQASAPAEATTDTDAAPDPEMIGDDLFDLVSFVMLMAAPQPEELTVQGNRGRLLFHEFGCSACHVARLNGPRGPLPVYSDLLLHDMGEELADGIVQGEASGSEFRTQPLWGLASVGPYLHDGRAETIADATLAHGGEALASRDAFAAATAAQQDDVVEFLRSLGGRDQFSTGLIEPGTPIPAVGDYGGPLRTLSADEAERFLRGREVFDREFGHATGVGGLVGSDGGPRFNGDSCRACHFDPVVGGAGPRGTNVIRHGSVDANGVFTAPPTTPNTILHTHIRVGFNPPTPTEGINVFEHRQPPALFGLGMFDAISDETILAGSDPEDADGDGISGRAHVLPDGRVGRLGWKAQVPSVAEFVRDAMAAEIGITLPEQAGLTFGIVSDSDPQTDPERNIDDAEELAFFISMLAAPPRQPIATDSIDPVANGESLFATVGCSKCHTPTLPSAMGDVNLYSDLLLHDILAAGVPGIEDGLATQSEFRTAPLWGLSQTSPYLHTGEADTIDQAIRLHAGEASAVRDGYLALSQTDRDALLAFLDSL